MKDCGPPVWGALIVEVVTGEGEPLGVIAQPYFWHKFSIFWSDKLQGAPATLLAEAAC